MAFEREAPNSRYVDTLRGDTLRRIALRELGNADQWLELALLNGLRPPYVVADEAERVAGVLVAGDPIRVPSAQNYVSADTEPDAVFGTDLLLRGGLLRVSDGDLALVSGSSNFRQAILTRLTVLKRELAYHPEFGNDAPRLIGRGSTPTVGRLAAYYVRTAILEDPRVSAVPSCTATIEGDAIRVNATIVPIDGRSFNFSEVL